MELVRQGVVHEAILRAVIDSTRDVVIFALDRGYRYLVFNETHRQTMRKIWNVDIAVGQSMLEAIGREDDRLRAKANFDRALAGEHFMVIEEYGDERFSRRYYEDLYSPIVGADGSVVGLTLFLTDITEQKRTAHELEEYRVRLESLVQERTQALEKKEELYRVLVTNAPIAVVVHRGRQVLYSNPAATRMFGEGIPPVETTHGVVREIRVDLVDGSRADVEWRTIRVPFEDDFADLSLVVDVTERRRAEEERRRLDANMLQTQKLESIGLLSGGVAHDFNNLLVGILGNADLALGASSLDVTRELVGRIKTAAQRASELTAQLLAYTGKKPLIVGALDLGAIAREMSELVRTSVPPGAELTLDLADGLPPFEGDGAQIRQVVMNLITNAADAIGGAGGRILIRTTQCEAPAERATTSIGAIAGGRRAVCLEVTDTGIGMDETTLSKMFEPFFSTKGPGRGLGLAAVIGIVKAHGGAIDVTSTPRHGSTFRVYFPASERAPASRAEPVSSVPSDWRGSGLVIVADDEPRVRQVLAMMLGDLGFEVIEASDTKTCIAVFRTRAKDVRALVIDLTMPGGGGGEVIRELRAEGHAVPVILSSGYPEDAISAEIRADRNLTFLEKPFDFETFARSVRRAVR